MHWPFAKYVACGNDFILFDNRKNDFPHTNKSLIQQVCDRRAGIGADGILLMENSCQADYKMLIFNADGSEAAMCGNGLRCFIKWIARLGSRKSVFRIELKEQIYTATLTGESVQIQMGPAREVQWNIPFAYENERLSLHFLHTGVPHLICFTNQIESINVMKWGSTLRHHSNWQPEGANASVVQPIHPHTIKMRTYERGVEAETPACGTGAVAAALAAAHQHSFQSPVTVQTTSKEELTVAFSSDFSEISLTGGATFVFTGRIDLSGF